MSSYAESASSVVRTLEYLMAKHGKALDKPAAPRVSREILAAIPRVAANTPRPPGVKVTRELHDSIYAEATTTFRAHREIAAHFGVSPSNVTRISSRRHPFYDPQRSEAFRYAHLKNPAA